MITRTKPALPLKLLGLVLGAAFATSALAQEKHTLRVADWMPTTHHISSQGGKVFMEKATELSVDGCNSTISPLNNLVKPKTPCNWARTVSLILSTSHRLT